MAVVAAETGAAALAAHPAAKDFVTDAHAHSKSIGHVPAAGALFDAAGLTPMIDAGYVALGARTSVTTFLEACRAGRYWERSMTSGNEGARRAETT